MTTADVVLFASSGALAWLGGYATGYLHSFIRKIFRHAADLS